MSVCVCKYPLIISDNRGQEIIDFLAFPIEILDAQNLPMPEINRIEVNNMEGKPMPFYEVIWNKLNHDNFTGYDIADHLIIAGCDPSDMSSVDGQSMCISKDLYTVLHPEEEWLKYHVLNIDDKDIVK